VDSNYAIADMKHVRPYVIHGCVAKCVDCMACTSRIPCCCCFPKMRTGGLRIGGWRREHAALCWLLCPGCPLLALLPTPSGP
jgi:hypothetical protein